MEYTVSDTFLLIIVFFFQLRLSRTIQRQDDDGSSKYTTSFIVISVRFGFPTRGVILELLFLNSVQNCDHTASPKPPIVFFYISPPYE